MDLEILGPIQGIDPEEDASGQDMKLGRIAIMPRQVDQVDLRVVVETQVVALAELNLQAAGAAAQLVPLDDHQVDLALFIALVLGALDEHVALHKAHPGITTVIIAVGLAVGQEGKDHGHRHQDAPQSL